MHRKVFNIYISPLNANKTYQKRAHFQKMLRRLREKKPTTTADFSIARALPHPQGREDFGAEGRGLWGSSSEGWAGCTQILTEYLYAKTRSVCIKILSKSQAKNLLLKDFELGSGMACTTCVHPLHDTVKTVEFGYCPSDCLEKI